MSETSFARRHALALYFVLAYAIAWSGIVLVVGPGNFPATGEEAGGKLIPVFLAMLAGPSIAGVAMTA